MQNLGTPTLVAIFAAGVVATWIAGVYLSRTTDALDGRLHLGEALGGMVLLAVAGTLPEVAITITAALQHSLDIAAGNLIGGIAMQTAVLVICDATASGKTPLSYLVGSLVPVLEGSLVIFIVAATLMGAMLPPNVAIAGVSPASIVIVVGWIAGIAVLNRVRKSPAWEVKMPGSNPGRPHRRVRHPAAPPPYEGVPTGVVAGLFGIASLVTLVAGVALATTGNLLADRAGINGIVFGATILALSTALPEISSGIAAVRLGDNQLAMGDIFGGNAFQLCLFLVADLIAGTPVLPFAGLANGWLAAVGIALTIVYVMAIVIRPKNCYARLGVDSIVVLGLLVAGVVGLIAVTGAH